MKFTELKAGMVLLSIVRIEKVEGKGGSASEITLDLCGKKFKVRFSQLRLFSLHALRAESAAGLYPDVGRESLEMETHVNEAGDLVLGPDGPKIGLLVNDDGVPVDADGVVVLTTAPFDGSAEVTGDED